MRRTTSLHVRLFTCSVALGALLTTSSGCEDTFGLLEETPADAKSESKAKAAPASANANAKELDPGAAKVAEDKAKSEARAQADANVVTLVRAYKTCLAECHEESGKSETDRETCRLTCEQGAEASAQTLAASEPKELVATTLPQVKQHLDTCVAECNADKKLSVNDRETCKLTCSGSVDVMVDALVYAEPERAPAGEATPETGCDQACDARVEVCKKGCDEDRSTRADDRATCKLLCGESKRFCVEACNAKRQG